MSYPTFVAAGTLVSNANNITGLAAPAGIRRGDLLLLLVETANQVVVAADITGETGAQYVAAPGAAPQGTGTAGNAGAVRLTVFYKFTAGTEANIGITDGNARDHTAAVILAFRNVDQLNPFNTSAGGVQTPAATYLTLPQVTTTRSQCMIVNVVASDRDLAATNTFSAWANATTGAPTERFDQTVATGQGGGFGVATALLGAAGASGQTTVTTTNIFIQSVKFFKRG
jgi:hypothetical protein